MKVLTLPYLPLLQHYSKINPPWLKAYASLLGPNAVSKRERDEVVRYSKAVWALSDQAKLFYFYLELLASRHENKLPHNVGWLAHELSILKLSQSLRSLAKCLDEALDVGLAVAQDVTSIAFSRQSPLCSLNLSESLEGTGEGSGERAPEEELPEHLRISRELYVAVEHYDLAAARGGWPPVRATVLRDLAEQFDRVSEEMLVHDETFDWLLCFGRAVEQPFLARIPTFGFEWFLKRDRETRKLNALKVWDRAFAPARAETADEISGLSGRRRSGYVLRWPVESIRSERDRQMALQWDTGSGNA